MPFLCKLSFNLFSMLRPFLNVYGIVTWTDSYTSPYFRLTFALILYMYTATASVIVTWMRLIAPRITAPFLELVYSYGGSEFYTRLGNVRVPGRDWASERAPAWGMHAFMPAAQPLSYSSVVAVYLQYYSMLSNWIYTSLFSSVQRRMHDTAIRTHV